MRAAALALAAMLVAAAAAAAAAQDLDVRVTVETLAGDEAFADATLPLADADADQADQADQADPQAALVADVSDLMEALVSPVQHAAPAPADLLDMFAAAAAEAVQDSLGYSVAPPQPQQQLPPLESDPTMAAPPADAFPAAASDLLAQAVASFDQAPALMLMQGEDRRAGLRKGFELPSLFDNFFHSLLEPSARRGEEPMQIISVQIENDDDGLLSSRPRMPALSAVFSRMMDLVGSARDSLQDLAQQQLAGQDDDSDGHRKGGCPLRMACGDDMAQFCSGDETPMSGDSIVACLLQHSMELSAECNALVQRRWGYLASQEQPQEQPMPVEPAAPVGSDFNGAVPTQSDGSEAECDEDADRLCPGIKYSDVSHAREMCLRFHANDLSSACFNVLFASPNEDDSDSHDQPAKQEEDAPAHETMVGGPCAAEVSLQCPNLGLVETLACLSEHRNILSAHCSDTMAEVPIFFCAEDIVALCPEQVEDGPSAIARCLLQHRDSGDLSEECVSRGLVEDSVVPAAPLQEEAAAPAAAPAEELPQLAAPTEPEVEPVQMPAFAMPFLPKIEDAVGERAAPAAASASSSSSHLLLPAALGGVALVVLVTLVVVVVRRVRQQRARDAVQLVQLSNPDQAAAPIQPLDVSVGVASTFEPSPAQML